MIGRIRGVLLLICALLSSALLQANEENKAPVYCFFTPPKHWDISDPSTLSPRVKIAFLKKKSNGLSPSINLAVEEVDLSLSEYLKAVKQIHERDRNNQWRQLGKVKTQAGLAQLTEIDTTSEYGPMRILQLILVKEGKAYVLTAAALKEDFPDYYKEIQTAFRSLTLSTDLFSAIPQLDRKEALMQMQARLMEEAKDNQEKAWKPFEKAVVEKFEDMGAFWQILVLQNAREKL